MAVGFVGTVPGRDPRSLRHSSAGFGSKPWLPTTRETEAEMEAGEATQPEHGHREGSRAGCGCGSVRFPRVRRQVGPAPAGRRPPLRFRGSSHATFRDPVSAVHPSLSWTWAGPYPFVEAMALTPAYVPFAARDKFRNRLVRRWIEGGQREVTIATAASKDRCNLTLINGLSTHNYDFV